MASTSSSSNALTASASTTKIPVPVPSLLKGLTLEDIINRWSSDLDDRVRDFTNLAAEIKAWDSVLIQNGDEISKLYTGLQALEPVGNTIDESLSYVESQQKEMDAVLQGYEAQLDEMLQGRNSNSALTLHGQGHGPSGSGSATNEREKAYQLAESLNDQLDDLSRSLTSLINEVNSISSTSASSSSLSDPSAGQGSSSQQQQQQQAQDPVAAISAILNAHLGSLSWIEKTTESLTEQVGELEGRVKQASGGRWAGIGGGKSEASREGSRAGTPNRSGASQPFGRSSAFGTPQRALLGGSTAGSGTPSRGTPTARPGQSNLGRSGIFGLGARR